MDRLLGAWSDFLAQPFGAFGAACIMLAVTAINSRWLAARLSTTTAVGPTIFNCLNLVGGACLLVNALIREEVVWIVLEIYFISIAIKGLVQLQQDRGRRRSAEVADVVDVIDIRSDRMTPIGIDHSPASHSAGFRPEQDSGTKAAAPATSTDTIEMTPAAPVQARQVANDPGWYPDPSTPSQFRWWSGQKWTEHTSNPSEGA